MLHVTKISKFYTLSSSVIIICMSLHRRCGLLWYWTLNNFFFQLYSKVLMLVEHFTCSYIQFQNKQQYPTQNDYKSICNIHIKYFILLCYNIIIILLCFKYFMLFIFVRLIYRSEIGMLSHFSSFATFRLSTQLTMSCASLKPCDKYTIDMPTQCLWWQQVWLDWGSKLAIML